VNYVNYIIEVDNLWWRYKGRDNFALKDINLKVKEKEILGIMGPSGSGKTTLCLTLNGIIPQRIPGEFKGKVKVFGKSVLECDVSEIASSVGLVLEDPEIQFVMSTVEDEVILGLEKLDLSREEILERLYWALELVNLPRNYLNKRPLELSGGEKQRVAIASMIALRPKILVLDEPTSDLDPKGKKEVFESLWRIREELGITVVIVEHESEFLAKFADRIVILNEGKVVAEGTPREVFSKINEIMNYGIRPPQVTEIGYHLGLKPLPLSLEEFINLFTEEFKRNRMRLLTRPLLLSNVSSSEVVIECHDVHFTYPDGTRALNGVDLEIEKGEFLAIVGPNGSGKTTLAKVMCGLLKPTKGKVLVFNEEPWKSSRCVMCKRVGYVFQNPDHQLFNQKVFDELAFGLRILGAEKVEIETRVNSLLKTLKLTELENEHPFFLSKGERRRLALGSVLALEPEVLIVDEPTTGQDYGMCFELMNLLKEYNESGKTVILISHSIPLVVEYVNRLVVMCDGRIIADGDPHEILSKDEVVRKAHLLVPQVTLVSKELRSRGYSIDPCIIKLSEFLSCVKSYILAT